MLILVAIMGIVGWYNIPIADAVYMFSVEDPPAVSQSDLFNSVEWCRDSEGYNRLKVNYKVDLWTCNWFVFGDYNTIYFGGRGYYEGATINYHGALFTLSKNGADWYKMFSEVKPVELTSNLDDGYGNICFFHTAGSTQNYYLMTGGGINPVNTFLDNTQYSTSDKLTFHYKNSGTYEYSANYLMQTSSDIYFSESVVDCGVNTQPSQYPNIIINSPTQNSIWSIPVEVDIDYENATGYDLLRIYLIGENDNGVEIISKSTVRTLTGDSGNLYLSFSGLPKGHYFLGGQFYNSVSGDSIYAINIREFEVSEYIPSFLGGELEPDDWSEPTVFNSQSYYSLYSSYATPTAFYNILTNPLNPVANWISVKTDLLKIQFNNDIAKEQGSKMAEGVQVMRYYSNSFNNLFGGFPLGDSLIILLFITMMVGVIRLVIAIRRMI